MEDNDMSRFGMLLMAIIERELAADAFHENALR